MQWYWTCCHQQPLKLIWYTTSNAIPLDWYTKTHATGLIHQIPCSWSVTPLSMQLNWYCTCNHTMLPVTPITVKAYRTQPTNHIWHSWTPSTCGKCLPLVTWSRATIKTFLHQKFVPASFSQPSTPFSLQYPSNFNLPFHHSVSFLSMHFFFRTTYCHRTSPLLWKHLFVCFNHHFSTNHRDHQLYRPCTFA